MLTFGLLQLILAAQNTRFIILTSCFEQNEKAWDEDVFIEADDESIVCFSNAPSLSFVDAE